MAYGLKIAKISKEEINSRVQKAAEILELQELLKENLANYLVVRDKGLYGRATVSTSCFLFDEPLSNLMQN